MTIDTNTIVSVSEANQNFSRVTRIADANGQAVIFKNNRPKYLLVDMESTPYFDMTDDEKIDVIAACRLAATVSASLDQPASVIPCATPSLTC